MHENVNSLQRNLAKVEGEKQEIIRNHGKLEKDRSALKKSLGKVSVVFTLVCEL